MKRPALPALAAAALLACAAAAPAAAQSPLPKSGKGEYLGVWSLSASGGRAVPSVDRYGGGPAWRLAAGYSPVPRLGLEVEFGRFPGKVAGDGPGGIPDDDLAAGTLDVRGLCASAVVRQPLPGLPVSLFALGGLGRYRVAYAMDDAPRARYEASGLRGLPDQKLGGAWGLHLGAGAEYVLGAHLSLVAEARYLSLAPEVSGHTTPGNRLEGTIDLGTLVVTGGVKVLF